MSRLFAIGDVHGHHAELMHLMQTLTDEAGLDPSRDTVVFLGDYVDYGPDTRGVVDQLIAWQEAYPHWVFLKGNHEDMMLDALVYNSARYGFFGHWWGQGGRETAWSYYPDGISDYERAIMQPAEHIPPRHLDWLHGLPLLHEQDGYLFVHAGLRPGIPLRWQNDIDLLWIREGFIFSEADFEGRRVVFGHTPFREPLVMPNKIGIDTLSHAWGRLTAAELDRADPRARPRFYHSPPIAGA